MKAREVSVGIINAPEIRFRLNGIYIYAGKEISGEQTANWTARKIQWRGQTYEEIQFIPADAQASFSIANVTIGVHFHWERQETQTFTGILKLITDGKQIVAINILPVEDYLISVISSEMSATSSLELLKAHAVISRSWLIAQINKMTRIKKQYEPKTTIIETDEEYIRWYDREDHQLFDVCADDHCQRYQGITKASNPNVIKAVQATRGLVLMNGNEICDARFSKCCGGISEEFEYAWEEKHYTYLSAIYDSKDSRSLPDLTQEKAAAEWIRTSPEAFCNTQNKKVLSQVLNHYDQETTNFFRWKVRYTQEELSKMLKEKSGIDFGIITDLIPIARGKSGRLYKLKIVGTKKTLTVGKELEIRRLLSPSHLFSSAFIIEKENEQDGIPQAFLLTGAGWGHGVGLCQIGAAMMGEQGYTFSQILLHYYKESQIKQLYS